VTTEARHEGDTSAPCSDTIRPVNCVVVSDLHLGLLSGTDTIRLPGVRDRLVRALAGAEHVVMLGDILELRERPVAELLRLSRPLFESLGEATAGSHVTFVPGNHDHALATPWLERLRVAGRELGIAEEWEVNPEDGALGRIASLMPATDVSVAYPGLFLRPDVYATHGHYLDLPLTVPRIESVVASAMARVTGRGRDLSSAAEYEAALGPMYAFFAGLAEAMSGPTLKRSGSLSRSVWQRANGRSRLGGTLITHAAIPGAVAALNRLGVGPLEPGISGEDLRRGGLNAMRRVAEGLVPDAAYLVFGHTHRPGPLPGDDESEWTSATGTRLWNSGSWCHEPAFVGPPAHPGPYWPGTLIRMDETGPPRIENVLEGVELPAPAL
jgi:predicted phosphodiesterase